MTTINDKGNSFDDPTIPEVATVTVKEAVDGTKPVRRRRRSTSRNVTAPHAFDERHLKVDPEVMKVAKSIQRPGQHLVIVSEHEVRVVNKR